MLRFLLAVVISIALIGVSVITWTVVTPAFRMGMAQFNGTLYTTTGGTGDAWSHGVTFQTGWINLFAVPLVLIVLGFLAYIYMNAQRTEWLSGRA
jgi:hypothetical protein